MNKQISWEIYFLNVKNPRASGKLCPLAPYQGFALDPLGALSGPQTPHPIILHPPHF